MITPQITTAITSLSAPQLDKLPFLQNQNDEEANNLKPLKQMIGNHKTELEKAGDLRDTFTEFVGQTFFGQMMKAMRSTTDKPAYFHGGRAEEVFQGQLDQALSEHMTEASASDFSEPMFEQQFPNRARLLKQQEQGTAKPAPQMLDQLKALPRR